MYLSFKRLVAIRVEDLPPAVQEGVPYPTVEGEPNVFARWVCWICVDEDGRTLIADMQYEPFVRFWDPQKKAWRECSTDSVMIK